MNIKWKIRDIDYIESKDDLEKVAVNVHFHVECRSEDGGYGFAWGNQYLNVDSINKDAFTPFDSITEAQAFEWMFKEMGDYHKGELEHYTIKQAMKNDQPSRKSGLPSNWQSNYGQGCPQL